MTSGFKVFVVDDESTIAFTLAAILRVNGYAARSFTSPLEALASAEQNAPNLLISDVMMPEMSGVELAIKMTDLCPSCKVILFSGQAATTDFLREARKAGYSFEIFQKPIHPQDLLKAVRQQQTVLDN